jgi:hypothetical protein
VKVTLAFGFTSEEQLGWDPTFGVTDDGHETITVQGRTYKITDTLSDHRGFSLLGRATRVFAVKDMETQEEAVFR